MFGKSYVHICAALLHKFSELLAVSYLQQLTCNITVEIVKKILLLLMSTQNLEFE